MPATEGRGSFWQANDNLAGEEIAKVVFSILTDYMQTFGERLILSHVYWHSTGKAAIQNKYQSEHIPYMHCCS